MDVNKIVCSPVLYRKSALAHRRPGLRCDPYCNSGPLIMFCMEANVERIKRRLLKPQQCGAVAIMSFRSDMLL